MEFVETLMYKKTYKINKIIILVLLMLIIFSSTFLWSYTEANASFNPLALTAMMTAGELTAMSSLLISTGIVVGTAIALSALCYLIWNAMSDTQKQQFRDTIATQLNGIIAFPIALWNLVKSIVDTTFQAGAHTYVYRINMENLTYCPATTVDSLNGWTYIISDLPGNHNLQQFLFGISLGGAINSYYPIGNPACNTSSTSLYNIHYETYFNSVWNPYNINSNPTGASLTAYLTSSGYTIGDNTTPVTYTQHIVDSMERGEIRITGTQPIFYFDTNNDGDTNDAGEQKVVGQSGMLPNTLSYLYNELTHIWAMTYKVNTNGNEETRSYALNSSMNYTPTTYGKDVSAPYVGSSMVGDTTFVPEQTVDGKVAVNNPATLEENLGKSSTDVTATTPPTTGFFTGIFAGITAFLATMLTTLMTPINAIWDILKTIASIIITGVAGLLTPITGILTNILDAVIAWAQSIVTAITGIQFGEAEADLTNDTIRWHLPDMFILLIKIILASIAFLLRFVVYIETCIAIPADSWNMPQGMQDGLNWFKNTTIPYLGLTVWTALSSLFGMFYTLGMAKIIRRYMRSA